MPHRRLLSHTCSAARLFLASLLPAFLGASVPASPVTLRVMSYNIHHGEGLDQKVDLERIARLITEARADIVGLQEVDRGVERSQRRDLPAELARLTGLTVQFDKNIDHQGGAYGNAVLTRFPLKSAKNTHYRALQPGEQRGVQQLILDVHGREVLFLNTHLDFRPHAAERASNVAELRAMIAAVGGRPVILVGDFNTIPGSPTHQAIKGFLTDTWEVVGPGGGLTVPVRKPSRRIDYIFISRGTIEPLSMQVLRSEASDHLPIVAEVRLR